MTPSKNDRPEEAADNTDVRTEQEIENFQHGHDGIQPEAPLATGPSYNLMMDDQKLGNVRLESAVSGGEQVSPDQLKVKKSAKDGEAVITGILTPTYGGEEVLNGAVRGRSGMDLKLEPVAEGGNAVSGHFRVNRLDHCGTQDGDRAFIVVLETAEKESSSD